MPEQEHEISILSRFKSKVRRWFSRPASAGWEINKVPICFVFGGHNPNCTPLLEPLRQRMELVFQSHPSGKIVYFMEHSFQYLEGAAFYFELVQRGWLPSEAFALLHPPNSEDDVFRNRELAILDELATEFPGRLLISSEWNPKDEIEEAKSRKYKNTTADLQTSISLAFEGDFDQAVVHFRRGIQNLAERVSMRDERMIDTIPQIVEKQRPIATFSYFGSGHTAIYQELQRAGFMISRLFPEKEERPHYLFDPATAAVRHYRFFPNRPYSDDGWHKMLVLSSIYHYIVQENLFTEQEASNLAWYGYRRASKEQIKAFEQKVKREGFIEALENP